MRLAAMLAALCLTASSQPAQAAGGPPTIVLIVVDTVRADHVTCYGYARPTSPSSCALGKEGVIFDRAYTTRTQTVPAISSILTGLYPYRHGVRNNYSVLPEAMTTLAERLRAQGYKTGGFVSSFVMVRDFSGLDQGFDRYDDFVHTREPFRENYERPARATVDRALSWLDAAGSRAFLFVHLIEPHGPYTPPSPFLERFALPAKGRLVPLDQVPDYQRIPGIRFVSEYVGRYDGEIASADAQIGRLLAHLRKSGRYGPALIILTADHGESQGEHGRWFEHGRSVGDHETHVPLLIKFPDRTAPPKGKRVTEPVSLVDIVPTVLAAAGLTDAAHNLPGVDLRALADGRPRGTPAPLTERLRRGRLTIAVHGRDCMLTWVASEAALAKQVGGTHSAVRSRWPALAKRSRWSPKQASPSCRTELTRAVTPLMADLLTFKLQVPVASRRREMHAPGRRSRFVAARGMGPVVPLKEHEREALRALGYLQ